LIVSDLYSARNQLAGDPIERRCTVPLDFVDNGHDVAREPIRSAVMRCVPASLALTATAFGATKEARNWYPIRTQQPKKMRMRA
jgi:hypothetical protein